MKNMKLNIDFLLLEKIWEDENTCRFDEIEPTSIERTNPYDGPIDYVGALRCARNKVYDLIKQPGGSRKYGNCEICGKPADQIYSYRHIFGHKECLEEKIIYKETKK